MAYISRKQIVEDSYRRVEAMYRKGCDTQYIMSALDLTKTEVLDIAQKIFAMDQKKKLKELAV